jgi:hypothetical protein
VVRIVHVFKIDEGIVDSLDFDILVAQGIPEDLYHKVSTSGDKEMILLRVGGSTIRPIRPNPLIPTLMVIVMRF